MAGRRARNHPVAGAERRLRNHNSTSHRHGPDRVAGIGGLTGFGLRIQPMPAPSVTIVASIQRSSEALAKRSICFSGCANSSGFC